MIALRKRVEQMEGVDGEFMARFDACAMTLARNQVDEGIACLAEITPSLSPLVSGDHQQGILESCAQGMASYGAGRIEFPVLALHTLYAG